MPDLPSPPPEPAEKVNGHADPAESTQVETEQAVEATAAAGATKSGEAADAVNGTADHNENGLPKEAADSEDEADFSNADFDDDGPQLSEKRASSRMSNMSLDNLHNVNLDDENAPSQEEEEKGLPPQHCPQGRTGAYSTNLDEAVEDVPPAVPAKEPKKKLSLSNLTNSLPTMPWSPSAQESQSKGTPNSITAVASAPAAPAQDFKPPPVSRKLTSPFSWLSRNSTSSQKENGSSPPTAATRSQRRDTASSIATLTSNPEMMLSKLEEGDETGSLDGRRRSVRNSLKDRFKLVRMREEAGITMPGTDGEEMPPNLHLGVTSPIGEGGGLDMNGPLSPVPPSPNPSMAPGTVSGVQAGPSAINDDQVDWDLWQNVVYEGPAAVARTSAEELNKAIATGIPNVIRGVVWQVLAQSKSDDLEQVYRDLVARGTEKDKDRHSTSTSISTTSNGTLSIDKEPVASSASSMHSDSSSPNGTKSPVPSDKEREKEADNIMKAQAMALAVKQRKEKEDAIKLSKLEKVIRKDMGARTSYSKYAQAAGLQDGLFGVCKAYALYDEDVSYAQGMNFLIMPLLFNMPEEEAFCLLVRLMNNYKLRDLFVQDMPGLHMYLYIFERLLEDYEPALYCHLHRRGITGHLYATQWFLTLFAYRFPLQLVLRIYDLILSEGLSAILKFGIVLMQKNAHTLLGMTDMGVLTTYLKDKIFDVYIDQSPSAGSILENGFFGSSSASADKEVYKADQLVRDACEVKVTPEILKAYTAEWEEKTRNEKEREQELDYLRTSNASYAIQLRKLEDRIEACDREQASMANELVHTKILNEELNDENESLKGQVRELRIVIEKQPEDIETAWKAERDNLMERNQRVHDENQRVEKEMAELEEQLVQTKMKYAEVCLD